MSGAGSIGRLLGAVVLAAAFLAPLAKPARATPFQATLSLAVESAIGTLGAVSFVGAGSGSSAPADVTVPSAVFAGAALLPVAGVASLSAASILVSGNGAGHFSPMLTTLRGAMPVSGALRVKGSLGGGPATLASVPLRFTAHHSASGVLQRGLGQGGYLLGPQDLYVRFEPWGSGRAEVPSVPWGDVSYSYHICCGPTASVTNFYNYTVATGSDARTPGGLGQVTLVSPIRIETTLPGAGSLLVVFGTLTLNFVPEPGTLVLFGAGAAALGLLGRGRLRAPPKLSRRRRRP